MDSDPNHSCWRVIVNPESLCFEVTVTLPFLNYLTRFPDAGGALARYSIPALRRLDVASVARNLAVVGVVAMVSGCGSIGGPGIDYTSPRVTGQAVDAGTGEPMKGVRVGRLLYTWKGPGGEFLKGGEELMLQQTYTRTDAEGRFDLPSRRAALLFRFGDYSMNMRLVLQKQGYVAWRTNFPMAALSTNQPGPEPRIEPGLIQMQRR